MPGKCLAQNAKYRQKCLSLSCVPNYQRVIEKAPDNGKVELVKIKKWQWIVYWQNNRKKK